MDGSIPLIYLLRGGHISPDGLIYGQTDPPLSEEGENEARLWAHLLVDKGITAVWASRLARSLKTARIITAEINKKNHSTKELVPTERLTALPVDGLQDITYGRWDGRIEKDIRRQFPDLWQNIQASPSQIAPSGGETYERLAQRVLPVFSRLCKESVGRTATLIVGHCAVNRIILAHLLGVSLDGALTIKQDASSLNIISYKDGKATVEALSLSLLEFRNNH